VHYERPVFILGVPRSGTSMLFQLLRASEELASLPGEGHDLWRTFHHPRYSRWRADAVGGVRWGERRYVMAYFASFFGARRFVEKTPDNTLRVSYVRELFPNAIFVVIKRNPCDGINSLINGWRHQEGRYRAYYVPAKLHIPGYDHKYRWCFTLIEGWRNYISSPIPDIAFAQWEQYVKAIAAAREAVPSSNWIEIHLEELLARPEETLARICEKIGIQKTPQLVAKLHELAARPVNALSAPVKDKWRRDNEQEITALLPKIAARSLTLGYDVDPTTGNCTISAVTKNTESSRHPPEIPTQSSSEGQPVFSSIS
jgi:LPS sulfotransferase NodH